MLTELRVTRRLALVLSRSALIWASTDCSMQNRKMHTAIASTVWPVRNQFLRRCFRRKGRNFISCSSLVPQDALLEVVLDAAPARRRAGRG